MRLSLAETEIRPFTLHYVFILSHITTQTLKTFVLHANSESSIELLFSSLISGWDGKKQFVEPIQRQLHSNFAISMPLLLRSSHCSYDSSPNHSRILGDLCQTSLRFPFQFEASE
jgi:hypothetical protein